MHILGKYLDDTLAERMSRLEFPRRRQCLFLKSDDGHVWYGLLVRYFGRKSRPLSVEPHVLLFCPQADAIVETGLEKIYKEPRPRYWGKYGNPIIFAPLYHLVRTLCGADRLPGSYDLEDSLQAGSVADRISGDFQAVAPEFFADTKTPRAMYERICANPGESGTGASLYAMALTHLLSSDLSANHIDELKRLWPCPMTDNFADYMKKLIA